MPADDGNGDIKIELRTTRLFETVKQIFKGGQCWQTALCAGRPPTNSSNRRTISSAGSTTLMGRGAVSFKTLARVSANRWKSSV